MNPESLSTPMSLGQPNRRRAIIAFWLTIAAIVISLTIQIILTNVVKNQQIDNTVGNISLVMTGWAINVGLVAMPLNIVALILGVIAVKRDKVVGRLKSTAVAAIIIASSSLILLPTITLVISIVVSQS